MVFEDLQHANDDDTGEDDVVDDSLVVGLPDGDDDDNTSTMSIDSIPAAREEGETVLVVSACQQTATTEHEPPHLPPATGEDSARHEPLSLPTAAEEEPSLPIPKGRNPHAHHLLGRGKGVFLSLDVEMGVEM